MSNIHLNTNTNDENQHESYKQSSFTWYIRLCEHSAQLVLIIDRMVSTINDENRFKGQIQYIQLFDNIFPDDYNSLMVTLRFFPILFMINHLFSYITDNEGMYLANCKRKS